MRPLKINVEEVGGGILTMKNSLVPAAQELWNMWEIHCLILVSLFLQVFLLLFAGMRRHNSSRVLSIALWLAYLSADSVAIFVLGHLAVRAGEPGHQLTSFWAAFVLVHLGGQDTITAFSKQDNELWVRHLLNLVTQTTVAGYTVAKTSWTDGRLKAAMVLVFLSGCFKYVERTFCLYMASPARLRSGAQAILSSLVYQLHSRQQLFGKDDNEYAQVCMEKSFNLMLKGYAHLNYGYRGDDDMVSVDAPLNEVMTILAANHLPDMLRNKFSSSSADRYKVYEFVGATLVNLYNRLYTKTSLRILLFIDICRGIYYKTWRSKDTTVGSQIAGSCLLILIMLYTMFQFVSTLIAMVLFWATEKGWTSPDLHASSSSADTTVSYILLAGALVLDVSSLLIFIYGNMRPSHGWSEEIAQYNMIKRHIMQQDTSGMASIRQWMGRHLGSWGVGLLDSTRVPIAQDHKSPIKEFILDSLLHYGIESEWNIASTRGAVALQERGPGSDSAWPGREEILKISINDADFPTSVLIWHIATDICYYTGDGGSVDSDQVKKHKQMSRELSNYIMYLLFKCGVIVTTNSQHVHGKVHDEIEEVLGPNQVTLGEKAAVMKLLEATPVEEEEKQTDSTIETQKHEELGNEQQGPAPVTDKDGSATNNSHIQKLVRSTVEALDTPVLPRARKVANVLISIKDDTVRWDLIASVWMEMLFYTAPRCGAAFHYEHLSTGGEFATHVLLLMRSLGPFLPPPVA